MSHTIYGFQKTSSSLDNWSLHQLFYRIRDFDEKWGNGVSNLCTDHPLPKNSKSSSKVCRRASRTVIDLAESDRNEYAQTIFIKVGRNQVAWFVSSKGVIFVYARSFSRSFSVKFSGFEPMYSLRPDSISSQALVYLDIPLVMEPWPRIWKFSLAIMHSLLQPFDWSVWRKILGKSPIASSTLFGASFLFSKSLWNSFKIKFISCVGGSFLLPRKE